MLGILITFGRNNMHYLQHPLGLLLLIAVAFGPSLLPSSHIMIFSKEPMVCRMRLASRFMIGFDTIRESWR